MHKRLPRPTSPNEAFSLPFVADRLLDVLAVDLAHGVGKLFCLHRDTPLSVKYSFIFLRIRVSRTETFFSERPTRPAISL